MIGTGDRLSGPRGQYRLLAEHGRGGFGVTFRAERVGDDCPVIVKALRLEGLPGWKALELFEREATVLRALVHPGIPALIDEIVLGDPAAPGAVALVMEHVPGTTLAQLARGGGLGPAQMLRWLAEVLEILDYLHHRAPPVIHRDITPKNVILRPDGRAVLVDFGSVQAALGSASTISSTGAGTFGYAPHEQFVGRASPASDLYGLGMTFLAVATGREPGDMDSAGLRVEVRQMIDADARLVRLVESLVEPDPRFRLQSAREALAWLAPLLGSGSAPLLTLARAPASVDLAPAGWEVSSDIYLERLMARLPTQGFTLTRGGDAGRTPLTFSAVRPGSAFGGATLRLCAARAEAIDGAAAGRPLEAVAGGLFVDAAAKVNVGAPSLGATLRALFGARTVVVPLVVASAGLGAHTVARVAALLREPDATSVVPIFIDLCATTIELIPPPSLQGDAREQLLASLRQLVAPAPS